MDAHTHAGVHHKLAFYELYDANVSSALRVSVGGLMSLD